MKNCTVITYVGGESPFVDRLYHSGLTFEPGQPRAVPSVVAERFLRHSDVFKEGVVGEAKPDDDSTQSQLKRGAAAVIKHQEAENQRFDLLQQVERMDKQALREFAKIHYKQDLHPNTKLEKLRDLVRQFVDQFGAP